MPTVPPATTLVPSRLRLNKATATPNGLGFPKPAEKQGAFCFVSFVLCLLLRATFSQKSTENEKQSFQREINEPCELLQKIRPQKASGQPIPSGDSRRPGPVQHAGPKARGQWLGQRPLNSRCHSHKMARLTLLNEQRPGLLALGTQSTFSCPASSQNAWRRGSNRHLTYTDSQQRRSLPAGHHFSHRMSQVTCKARSGLVVLGGSDPQPIRSCCIHQIQAASAFPTPR